MRDIDRSCPSNETILFLFSGLWLKHGFAPFTHDMDDKWIANPFQSIWIVTSHSSKNQSIIECREKRFITIPAKGYADINGLTIVSTSVIPANNLKVTSAGI